MPGVGIHRPVNDLNPDTIRIHRYLKSDPTFIDRIMEIRQRLDNADMMVAQYWKAKFDLKFGDDMEQALGYWYLSRVAWGQFVRRQRINIASFSWSHFRNGIHPVTPKLCESARDLLRDVTITEDDYSAPLEAPGDDVWIFLDPAYYVDHHCSPLYEIELSVEDHVILAERLRRCPHKFLMTINWNEFTDDLYVQPGDFDIIYRPYRYSGVLRKIQPLRTELIVRNYQD